MHGIIFSEVQRFVQNTLGQDAWAKVLAAANLTNHAYVSVSDYPDAEFFAIVEAASRIARKSTAETTEAFGMFIAPGLLRMYSVLIKPEWKTLDVIEHTETVIHSVVRIDKANARPPALVCRRIAPDEIELRYDSERRLCRMARGIMRGIAHTYQEGIEIVEYECMLNGAPACVLRVRNAQVKAPPTVVDWS